jgi:hypothetical protein
MLKCPSGIKTLVIPLVLLARELAEQTELHSTLDRVANGSGYFDQALLKALTFQELQHQLTVLREAIEADLEKRHFVFTPSEKAKLLTEMPASWEQV